MDLLSEEYLAHHGVLGQKWGVRRYQNADGSYTEAGKGRYAQSSNKWLSRKVNASKEDRQAHGKELVSKGKTSVGAIGRAVVRHYVAGAATGAGVWGALGVAAVVAAPAVTIGAAAAAAVMVGAGATYQVSSAVRGYQEVSDIQQYRNSK